MSDLTAIALGTPVEYRDSNGRRKAALIVGTAESIDEGSSIEVPDEGHAHLAVFSPTGSRYMSLNIPEGEGPHTFTVR